jgi:hypothetical protein
VAQIRYTLLLFRTCAYYIFANQVPHLAFALTIESMWGLVIVIACYFAQGIEKNLLSSYFLLYLDLSMSSHFQSIIPLAHLIIFYRYLKCVQNNSTSPSSAANSTGCRLSKLRHRTHKTLKGSSSTSPKYQPILQTLPLSRHQSIHEHLLVWLFDNKAEYLHPDFMQQLADIDAHTNYQVLSSRGGDKVSELQLCECRIKILRNEEPSEHLAHRARLHLDLLSALKL